MEFLATIFLLLALIGLVEALSSWRDGIVYLRLFRKCASRGPGNFLPPLTLIVPCRGIDAGLERNLKAYLQQDYPDFQLLLVTGGEQDPSVPILRSVLQQYPAVSSQLLFAGRAESRAQKIHNLLYAIQHARSRDQVLAFGDSDIRPAQTWLRRLVDPLSDPCLGVSTGYRWYLPQQGGFASVLRSVWNAGIASLMKEKDCYFAWGGSMAVRREVFERCRVPEYWENALSDDFSISRAMKDCSRAIHFQPYCLSFSHEDCSLRELWRWSSRQLSITRVYHPRLWAVSFMLQTVNCLVLWGGTAFTLLGRLPETTRLLLAALIVAIYLLGCGKGWLRLKAVALLFPERRAALYRHAGAYICWGPLAALVSVTGMIRSLGSREIEWRGIRYRMVSANETVVLGNEEY